MWNFNYWSDEIEAKKGWVDSYGGKADGTIDDFIRRMGEFCPGRQIGGLVLNTPNLAADGWGHSAWSAEECRRASAEGGFFGCAMNVRIRHPSTPQHRRNLCTGSLMTKDLNRSERSACRSESALWGGVGDA